MRTPRRLQIRRPVVKPGKLRKVRFVPCLRCMGHGHFETDPPEPVPVVALSKRGALSYVAELEIACRITMNQAAMLQTQVLGCELPWLLARDIESVVDDRLEWEAGVMQLEEGSRTRSPAWSFGEMDIADLVHEFVLRTDSRFRSQ